MYLYIFLYGVFVYLSDQIALNYVVCIYFASPGASHLPRYINPGSRILGFYMVAQWQIHDFRVGELLDDFMARNKQ